MASKCYDFSGITIGIQSKSELAEIEALRKFRSDCVSPDYLVTLEYRVSLPDAPNSWYEDGKQWHCAKTKLDIGGPDKPFVYSGLEKGKGTIIALEQLHDSFGVSSVFRHLPLHHALLEFDAFVLHAAYILLDGYAILFSAPSGTGKSTQADLWKKFRGARIINGDRVLIRCAADGFTAGGLYYSGTSEYCENVTAPIRAIVLLGQAKSNTIEKCTGGEAFRRLFHECSYSSEYENDPAMVATLLTDVVNEIDIVKLDCLPDESAVNTLENYLLGDND